MIPDPGKEVKKVKNRQTESTDDGQWVFRNFSSGELTFLCTKGSNSLSLTWEVSGETLLRFKIKFQSHTIACFRILLL